MADAPQPHGPRRPGYERLLLLAEKIGSLVSRVELIEREFATQRAALDVSQRTQDGGAAALNAALRGIEALSCHILDGRVKELDKKLGANVERIESGLAALDKVATTDAQALQDAKQELGGALAQIREHFDAACKETELGAQREVVAAVEMLRGLIAGVEEAGKGQNETLFAELGAIKGEFERIKSRIGRHGFFGPRARRPIGSRRSGSAASCA